jgi:ActR/RegA family two-component response regulator
VPLIVVEDHTQCIAALTQKAALHAGFIGVLDEDDPGIFEEILGSKPGLKLIAVGDHNPEAAAGEAVRRGAAGYILLPAETSAILAAAR